MSVPAGADPHLPDGAPEPRSELPARSGQTVPTGQPAPATAPLPVVPPPQQATADSQAASQSGLPPMIRVEHVCKRFGEKTVVDDLTFDVWQGEIFGFIGPSG